MKGSIYKAVAPNGRISWRYQIDAGRDESGKRIRISESGFKREREANDALHDKMQELRAGPARTSGTLKEYLDQWLPYHTKAKPLSPTTAGRYESLLAHTTGALGRVALKDLTVFALDNLYVKLAETRTVDGVEIKGLSPQDHPRGSQRVARRPEAGG